MGSPAAPAVCPQPQRPPQLALHSGDNRRASIPVCLAQGLGLAREGKRGRRPGKEAMLEGRTWLAPRSRKAGEGVPFQSPVAAGQGREGLSRLWWLRA